MEKSNNFINKLKSFYNDKVRFLTFIFSILNFGYHTWQYTQCGNPLCIFRIVMYLVISITTLVFGMETLYFELIGLSLVAAYFNTFVNFTAFFVLLLACRLKRKSEYWLLAIYAINEAVALIYQDKEISHLLIHLTTCAFFYLIYFYINKPKVLELKPDEEEIIKQLANGKFQKEIDLYSKNIIKEKIDHAMIRNHCSKEELIFIYKQSHPQSQE